MNEQILKGNWKMVKGLVQKKWGKLTNEELDQIQGDYKMLAGKIQKAYGYTLEEGEKRVRDFLNEVAKEEKKLN